MKSIPNVSIDKLTQLKKFGYESIPLCSNYEVLRLVCELPFKVTLILYSSGKLVIQTKKDKEDVVVELLNKVGIDAKKIDSDKKEPQTYEQYEKVVGSDETLKGDTFGGIVVAAVYADKSKRAMLKELGVDDSKKITDERVLELAPRLMATFDYAVENIYPIDYNKAKVTPLLNRLHSDVALVIKPQGAVHVVDKYPGCFVGDVRVEKAESKYLEVAAASIIARYYALKQIEELSRRIGFDVPMGSTHVKKALKKLKESGLDPKEFVKTSFTNVKEALGL